MCKIDMLAIGTDFAYLIVYVLTNWKYHKYYQFVKVFKFRY